MQHLKRKATFMMVKFQAYLKQLMSQIHIDLNAPPSVKYAQLKNEKKNGLSKVFEYWHHIFITALTTQE